MNRVLWRWDTLKCTPFPTKSVKGCGRSRYTAMKLRCSKHRLPPWARSLLDWCVSVVCRLGSIFGLNGVFLRGWVAYSSFTQSPSRHAVSTSGFVHAALVFLYQGWAYSFRGWGLFTLKYFLFIFIVVSPSISIPEVFFLVPRNLPTWLKTFKI